MKIIEPLELSKKAALWSDQELADSLKVDWSILAKNSTWRQQVKLFIKVLEHVDECVDQNKVDEVRNVNSVVNCGFLRISIRIEKLVDPDVVFEGSDGNLAFVIKIII